MSDSNDGFHQSRESEKQILTVQKDIEHLQYVIKELEEQCDFVKNHFTTKNGERLDDIKVLHGRIESHQQTDLDFHEQVRKKISCRFDILDERIRLLDNWKWTIWGALMVTGALFGYFTPLSLK